MYFLSLLISEFKNCVVEYSGSICPYPPENANSARLFSNIPIPLYDGWQIKYVHTIMRIVSK